MKKYLIVIILSLVILLPSGSYAKDLKVTVIERDPFVKIENGEYSGFSIDLWEAIAENRGWSFGYEPVDSFVELLRAPRTNSTDLAIANISITSDREEVMDFSTPIFDSGLQIMIPNNNKLKYSLDVVLNRDTGTTFCVIFFIFILMVHLMWYFEKEVNEHININYKKGILQAMWCIATLGQFGNRSPRTIAGRIVFLVWIATSILLFSFLIAQFSSNLTQKKISNSVNSYHDLHGKKVGTTRGSTSEVFLRKKNIDVVVYDDVKQLFEDVSKNKIDAAVHDAPLVQYYASHGGLGRVIVAGEIIEKDFYGIALPTGSLLRSDINVTLLYLKENGTYQKIYDKWFK